MTTLNIDSYAGMPTFRPDMEGIDWDNMTFEQAQDVKSACYEILVNTPSQIKAIASILYSASDSSAGIREEDITQISMTIHHLTQLIDDAVGYDILADNWLYRHAPAEHLLQSIDCLDSDKVKIKETVERALSTRRAMNAVYADMTEEEKNQSTELLRTVLSMENPTREAMEEAFPDFPKETAGKLLKLLEVQNGEPLPA